MGIAGLVPKQRLGFRSSSWRCSDDEMRMARLFALHYAGAQKTTSLRTRPMLWGSKAEADSEGRMSVPPCQVAAVAAGWVRALSAAAGVGVY